MAGLNSQRTQKLAQNKAIEKLLEICFIPQEEGLNFRTINKFSVYH
jgi:hypothetical protein